MSDAPLRITPDMLLSRRVDFERRMRRIPPVTMMLIAVLAVVFAIEAAAEIPDSRDALLAAGALDAAAVRAGQYWRLVSATLLHGSFEHLVSNAVALLIVGMVGEHAFGRGQFLLLYLGSGLAGSLLSVLTSPGPSVGASGAIFGLQAAAVVLFRRARTRLLMRDRRIGVVLLVWALLSIAGGIMSPYIDNGAHVGGAIGGALIGRRLHPVVLDPMSSEQKRVVRRWLWVAAAVLAYTLVGWLIH